MNGYRVCRCCDLAVHVITDIARRVAHLGYNGAAARSECRRHSEGNTEVWKILRYSVVRLN
uniref:Uncharacterized protein n=1 Tax=uncultured Rhodospirillales bacterium HF0200_01O14 TaxID=710787 RepID=E0XTX4_9PROT|nr:hypothetical protein [uncultured Rhodospirillales bacterium HF0200_01O14]